MVTIFRKIAKIKLFVSKKNKNEFANFNFRNLDDILLVLKPELEKNNLYMYFTEVEYDIDKLFMKINILDLDQDTNNLLSIQGQIKIDWGKSKMDDSQRVLSAKTFLKKSLIEDIFCLSSDDPDGHDNTSNSSQNNTRETKQRAVKKEVNATNESGTNNINNDVKEKTTEPEMRSFITKALLTMSEGSIDDAKVKLKKYTSFTGSNGNEVPGIDDTKLLNGKRLQVTYGKVKTEFNKYKEDQIGLPV